MENYDINTGKKIPTDQEVVTGIKNRVTSVTNGFYKTCRDHFEDVKRIRENTNYDDRQEIFQKAFITLWEKIEYGDIYVENGQVMVKRKDAKTKEIASIRIDSLVSYFIGTVFKIYLEFLRKHGREIPTDMFPDHLDDTSDEEFFSSLMAIVDRAIKQMPQHCREIISMFYLEEMTLEEILERRKESSSYNGLKNGKAKCMKKLRELVYKNEAA